MGRKKLAVKSMWRVPAPTDDQGIIRALGPNARDASRGAPDMVDLRSDVKAGPHDANTSQPDRRPMAQARDRTKSWLKIVLWRTAVFSLAWTGKEGFSTAPLNTHAT